METLIIVALKYLSNTFDFTQMFEFEKEYGYNLPMRIFILTLKMFLPIVYAIIELIPFDKFVWFHYRKSAEQIEVGRHLVTLSVFLISGVSSSLYSRECDWRPAACWPSWQYFSPALRYAEYTYSTYYRKTLISKFIWYLNKCVR